uniref:BZIP domain-containing protein n=1 Tax=Gongylonema pulchrum TaxID=637853 RepID=A0A183EL93_9BILA
LLGRDRQFEESLRHYRPTLKNITVGEIVRRRLGTNRQYQDLKDLQPRFSLLFSFKLKLAAYPGIKKKETEAYYKILAVENLCLSIYRERRDKNNLAAKKSRSNRREREKMMQRKVDELEKENEALRAQLAIYTQQLEYVSVAVSHVFMRFLQLCNAKTHIVEGLPVCVSVCVYVCVCVSVGASVTSFLLEIHESYKAENLVT